MGWMKGGNRASSGSGMWAIMHGRGRVAVGVQVGRVDDDRAEGVVDGAVCGDARV